MPRPNIQLEILAPWAEPSHPEFALPLLTTNEWGALSERTNCWALDLDPSDAEPQTDAVLATFDLPQTDCYLRDWTPTLGTAEAAAVAVANAQYAADIASEAAKATPDTEQIARWTRLIGELAGGYWQEAPNKFGDGGTALYRALSSPNIPCEIRSNWLLDADRPWTIWLHRFLPDDAQKDCTVDIEWAHWRLRLKSESAAELFRFVDGVTEAEVDAAEAAAQDIRDAGKLTGADKVQIKAWKDAIAKIKADAKPGKPNAAGDAMIKQYEDLIQALKDSKAGLTKSQTIAIKSLEDSIYEDIAQVALSETTQSLFGADFSITVLPQQRGYLTLALNQGKNQWTYEDKLVTKTRKFQVMQARTRIRVRGNGGSFLFQVGYPDFARYFRMVSRYIGLGWEWDGTGAVTSGSYNQLPGTSVEWSVEQDPADAKRLRYYVEGYTDGRYTPFVYAVDLEIPAGARTADNSVLWSSIGRSYESVQDCSPRHEERDGGCVQKAYSVEVLNANGQADLLKRCTGYQARLYENGALMYWGHVTADPTWELLHEGDGERNEKVDLLLSDGWNVLGDSTMEAALTGDGKDLAVYLAEVAKGIGLATAELSIVLPTITLPNANVGAEKRVRPAFGSRRGEWVRHLMETYAAGCEAYFDEQHRFVARVRPTTQSGATLTDTRTTPTQRNVALRPIEGGRDTGEFYNDILVVGGMDPETKRNYAARYVDWSSIRDRTSPNYIGRRKKMEKRNEDLNTQAATTAHCRRLVQLHCRPNLYERHETHWDSSLRIGQRLYYDGVAVEITSIDGGGSATDRIRLQVRYL